jgi:hypothetical protein
MERSLKLLHLLFSEQIFLPISIQDRQKAWNLSQDYSCNSARWTAFINQLMLNKTKEWLLSPNLPEKAKISIRKNLPSIWEFVTGTPIELDGVKIILIPNESTDNSTFYVPAEWVDIPGFTADYYLAAQVILAEEDDEEEYSHLRISGYTTWKDLKHGDYDELTRTYSLEREDLSEEVEYFLTHKEARTKQNVVVAIPDLSAPLLTKALEEVSKPSGYSPRYKLPLNQWLPLIGDDKIRHQIYQTRTIEIRKEKEAQQLSSMIKNRVDLFSQLSISGNLQSLVNDVFSLYNTLNYAYATRLRQDEDSRERKLEEIMENTEEDKDIIQAAKLELAKIAPNNPKAAKIIYNQQFYLVEKYFNLVITSVDSTNEPENREILMYLTIVDEESLPSELTLSLLDEQENLIEEFPVNPNNEDVNEYWLESDASLGEIFYIQFELHHEILSEKLEVR